MNVGVVMVATYVVESGAMRRMLSGNGSRENLKTTKVLLTNT